MSGLRDAVGSARQRAWWLLGISSEGHAIQGNSAAAERSRRAALTSITGIAARVISLGVSLITVPILLRYLGVEQYGVWLTISSGAAWLALLQVGVGPSVINRLGSIPELEKDNRRAVTSTAWWLMVAVTLLGLAPLALLYVYAPWAEMLNVAPGPLADQARDLAGVIWVTVSVGLVFAIPVSTLRARQEGYVANVLDIAGSVVRLVVLVVLVQLALSMVELALAFAVFGFLMTAAATAYVFWIRAPDTRPTLSGFDPSVARRLLTTGGAFTVLSIAALVIGYTDLIVITQVMGPGFVPAYSVAFSLLGMLLTLELSILDAVWPAYVEAKAAGDHRWLVKTHRRITKVFVSAAAAFGLVLVFVGLPLIEIWVGREVEPPFSLLVVIGMLAVVQAYQLPHGRILTSLGQVGENAKLASINAAVNLPVSIVLVSVFGITGAAAGTLVGYLIVGPFVVRAARRAIAEVGVQPRSALSVSSAR